MGYCAFRISLLQYGHFCYLGKLYLPLGWETFQLMSMHLSILIIILSDLPVLFESVWRVEVMQPLAQSNTLAQTQLSWGVRGQSLLIGLSAGMQSEEEKKETNQIVMVIHTRVFSSCLPLPFTFLICVLKAEYARDWECEGWGSQGRGCVGCLALCRVIRSESRLKGRKRVPSLPFLLLSFFHSAPNSVWSSNSLSEWMWMNGRMNGGGGRGRRGEGRGSGRE